MKILIAVTESEHINDATWFLIERMLDAFMVAVNGALPETCKPARVWIEKGVKFEKKFLTQ